MSWMSEKVQYFIRYATPYKISAQYRCRRNKLRAGFSDICIESKQE